MTKEEKNGVLEQIVAYSPTIIFAVMLISVVIHINLPLAIGFNTTVIRIIGFVVMLLSPLIIIWAQNVRRSLYQAVTDRTCFNFFSGPYRFSRHPIYLGLILVLLGFALLLNSVVTLVLTVLTIIFFSFVIIPIEERELDEHCPGVYAEYKTRVRMWL